MIEEIIEMFDKIVDENRELAYLNPKNDMNNQELDEIQHNNKVEFRAKMLNFMLYAQANK